MGEQHDAGLRASDEADPSFGEQMDAWAQGSPGHAAEMVPLQILYALKLGVGTRGLVVIGISVGVIVGALLF